MSEAEVNSLELGESDVEPDESGHRAPSWIIRQLIFLRHWLARGKVGSKYWVPRFGDRVQLRGEGTWLVYGVSIRRGVVQLGRPGAHRLEDVSPATREDLDELYKTRFWDPPSGGVPSRVALPSPGPAEIEELELTRPDLRVVRNIESSEGQD